jgi:hypothetical protein
MDLLNWVITLLLGALLSDFAVARRSRPDP